MNDDFEEDYEEEYEKSDPWQDAKDTYDDIKGLKDKYKKYKNKEGDGNSLNPQEKAKEFDNQLKDKNMVRSQNPQIKPTGGTAAGNATATTGSTTAATGGTAAGATGSTAATAGTTAAGTTGTAAATAGSAAGTTAAATAEATAAATAGTAATTTAATAAGTTAATAAGTTAATAAGTTAAATAGTTAATAAATGGAVAAQAAIPVVGWIALAVEAAIVAIKLIKRAKKRREERDAENGVNTKALKRLLKASPLLIPIAGFILLIIILVQSETMEKTEFMYQAVKCFESKDGCKDFLNTGIKINGINGKVIRATDLQLIDFVADFIRAEDKYYGSQGSSFMSDLVNDLNDVAKEGLGDECVDNSAFKDNENNNQDEASGDPDPCDVNIWDKIKEKLMEYINNSFLGKVTYGLNLFKWMKLEKKVYQNIKWYKAHLDTATGFATFDTLKTWVNVKFDNEPKIAFGDTVTKEAIAVDSNPFNSYLPTPLGVGVDECIETLEPYLPSWVELYALYVSTGNYDLTDDLYEYYTDQDNYQIEVTLYELATVKQTEKIAAECETKYYVTKDGQKTELSQEEYDKAVSEGERGFFAWLGDKLQDLFTAVAGLFNELQDWVVSLLGFNISVTTDWVPVVTYGNAFKYMIDQEYSIKCDKTVVYINNSETRTKSTDTQTIEYTYDETTTDSDGKTTTTTKKADAEYQAKIIQHFDKEVTTWTNKLQYVSTNTTEYEAGNRFLQAFTDIINDKGYKYTIDDVAIASEIIESFCGQTYSTRGASIDYSALPDGEFGWPVPSNYYVAYLFGNTTAYGGNHLGIDIWSVNANGNPDPSFNLMGTVDIVAAQEGTVIEVVNGCADGNDVSSACGGTYGNHVMIKHKNNYVTMYAHLYRDSIAVREGQTVSAGQFLGKMGSSGHSTGTHLHFEIRFSGNRIDPLVCFGNSKTYKVVPYNYNLPYESRNNSGITMQNPYKVEKKT